MEILIMLFVLLAVFIILPALVIFLIVLLASKTLRQKIRALFGVKRENGQIVSLSNSQTPVNTDKDDITQDFVDFMNENNMVNNNYVYTNLTKTRKGAIEVEVEMVPIIADEVSYEVSDEEQDKIYEIYSKFIVDNNYVSRLIETDENNPFAVNKLINEMNDRVYGSLGREVWESSSSVIQQVFKLYKDDYTGDHSVDGIAVMVEVNKVDVFKVNDFELLKESAKVM